MFFFLSFLTNFAVTGHKVFLGIPHECLFDRLIVRNYRYKTLGFHSLQILSVYLVYVSVCLFACLCVYVCLTACLCVCLSVCLSVCQWTNSSRTEEPIWTQSLLNDCLPHWLRPYWNGWSFISFIAILDIDLTTFLGVTYISQWICISPLSFQLPFNKLFFMYLIFFFFFF